MCVLCGAWRGSPTSTCPAARGRTGRNAPAALQRPGADVAEAEPGPGADVAKSEVQIRTVPECSCSTINSPASVARQCTR